ncbi:hypothetical protein HQ48_04735 [Porphyromonas sp. COT-290 OH3588]|nr:hypothetical protein HQ48_04735 [Porphyromonas sp. COT-290 OH3588]
MAIIKYFAFIVLIQLSNLNQGIKNTLASLHLHRLFIVVLIDWQDETEYNQIDLMQMYIIFLFESTL